MMKTHAEAAETVLGKPRRRKKPWISDRSWKLVEEREEINKKILGTRSERVKTQLRKKYTEKKSEVKKSIRTDKRIWMDGIADEAEDAARNQHMRTLYGLTKILCNERSRRSGAVLDKGGNLLSSKEDIQARWTEHFQEILNREAPTNPITEEEDNSFEFTDIIEEIATNEPTLGEVKSAMGRLKNGKSPEKITDSITAELLRAVGEPGEWFEVTTGVKQGCNMSGFLFLIVLDWVMRRTVGNGENRIRWKFTSKLDDLDFADDIALLSSTKQQMQDKLNKLDAEARRVGLKINMEKTKMMRINSSSQEQFTIGTQDRIEEVEEFSYLQ